MRGLVRLGQGLLLVVVLSGCRLASPTEVNRAAPTYRAPDWPQDREVSTAVERTEKEVWASQLPSLSKSSKERSTVRMKTSIGAVVIEVYPQAAPKASERFLKLVKEGFFDKTPVCRVVDDYLVQFGVNWREPYDEWSRKNIKDEPVRFAVEKGTLTFARSGPDKAATQVQIHLRDNPRLAQLGYAPFARVVEGMGVVERFAQVGDPSLGLDQGRLWAEGDAYLATLEKPATMIESVEVLESEDAREP